MKNFFFVVLLAFTTIAAKAEQNWTLFTSANSGLKNDTVSSIALDKSGTLWVATRSGLITYSNGNWQGFSSDVAEFFNDGITSLAPAPDGSLLFGTLAGMGRITNGQVTMIENESLQFAAVSSVAQSGNGTIWAAVMGEGIAQVSGQNLTMHTGPDDAFTTSGISDIVIASDGKVFALLYGNGVAVYNGTSWTMVNAANGFDLGIPFDMTADASGNVWIATLSGLARYSNGGWALFTPETSGFPTNTVTSVAAGSNGTLWLGPAMTRFDGVNFTADLNFVQWVGTQQAGLTKMAVTADGTVYAILEDKGLVVYTPVTNGIEENISLENAEIIVKSGEIFFRNEAEKNYRVEIFSSIGERIFSSERFFSAGENEIGFEGKFSSGVYFVNIGDGIYSRSKKFLVQ